MSEPNDEPTPTRREFLEKGKNTGYALGMAGVAAGGGMGGLLTLLSGAETADVLSNPNYWKNAPIKHNYEPATEYAAENGEVKASIYHINFDRAVDGITPAPDNVDAQEYTAAVDRYLGQVGLGTDIDYTTVEPQNRSFLPDEPGNLHEFERDSYEKGLFALMDAVNDELRKTEEELIGVIGPFNQAFVGGQAPPELSGVFHMDTREGMSNSQYGRTTAHEILHELGVGHTLFDGMSNVPFSGLLDNVGSYFGGETRGWWNGIDQKYDR